MFDLTDNKELLNKVFSEFQLEWHVYQRMYWYYMGITKNHNLGCFDTATTISDGFFSDFTNMDDDFNSSSTGLDTINDRSKHKTDTNYIKKFVKEEVSYSVGNDINYISHSGNEEIVNVIKYNTAHWAEDHDAKLLKNMLMYSIAYELYYTDKDAKFCSKIISPRHGIAFTDDYGNIKFFLHIFREKLDPKMYIDIYTDTEIIHCNETFEEISRQFHPFGIVPVSIAQLSEEGWLDTIYHDIKGLQDAYEKNLSDLSQEISEFRNAYLVLNNVDIKDDDVAEMKKKGILKVRGSDGSTQWLVKNINDNFVQNTLTTIEDKIYQITSHINTNEKMQSNTSSLALRARLIGIEERCKLNNKALTNCIKNRLKMMFSYLNNLKSTNYDYLDIKLKYTPNIPSDDLVNSQIISTMGDRLSLETGLSLLGFIDNPANEVKKVLEERKANIINNPNNIKPNDNKATDTNNLNK